MRPIEKLLPNLDGHRQTARDRDAVSDCLMIVEAIVDAYREAVHDSMLSEIAAFALDPVFSEFAAELAVLLRCEVSEAAEALRPVTHRVYNAAERAQ